MTYVISIYQLGYLPEGEPYATESLDDALNVLRSEIRNTIDAIEDDGEFLDADTALHVADVDGKARESMRIGQAYAGYYYDVAGYRHSLAAY